MWCTSSGGHHWGKGCSTTLPSALTRPSLLWGDNDPLQGEGEEKEEEEEEGEEEEETKEGITYNLLIPY